MLSLCTTVECQTDAVKPSIKADDRTGEGKRPDEGSGKSSAKDSPMLVTGEEGGFSRKEAKEKCGSDKGKATPSIGSGSSQHSRSTPTVNSASRSQHSDKQRRDVGEPSPLVLKSEVSVVVKHQRGTRQRRSQ